MDLFTKTIELEEFSMDYFSMGYGQPLIIIPGFQGFFSVKGHGLRLAWELRNFIGKYKLFLFNPRNSMPKGFTTSDMASDLAMVLNNLKVKKGFILGLSWGGMVAQELAIKFPELVERMALVSTTARETKEMNKAYDSWLKMINEGNYEALGNDLAITTYNHGYSKARVKKILTTASIDSQNILNQANAFLNHNSYGALNKIKCPTLIIGSMKDKVLGPVVAREIAQGIPRGKLILYAQEAHGMFDEVSEVKKEINNFFINKG